MSLKRTVQATIRGFHKLVAMRDAPEKLALYFHELEEHQYEGFSDCIAYWKSQGYRCVGASEFLNGQGGKLLFVSFDDNFNSWHRALPLLAKLDVKATFYMNTLPIRGKADPAEIEDFFDRIGHKGERATLSEGEIREIATAGHFIGCHSHSHFDLGSVSEEVAKTEIQISKEILEDLLQRKVADFSYPFGMRRNFTERLRDYCFQIGFETICNAIPGRLHEAPRSRYINRTPWDFTQSMPYNIDNMKIDGRMFERFTGRSAVV